MVLQRLGLLVRSSPSGGRSGRDQLDIALAAAAMGVELELFFIGAGVAQLLAKRDPAPARLPAGHRAWAALPGLTTVRAWVDRESLKALGAGPDELALQVQSVSADEMPALQSRCERLLVL